MIFTMKNASASERFDVDLVQLGVVSHEGGNRITNPRVSRIINEDVAILSKVRQRDAQIVVARANTMIAVDGDEIKAAFGGNRKLSKALRVFWYCYNKTLRCDLPEPLRDLRKRGSVGLVVDQLDERRWIHCSETDKGGQTLFMVYVFEKGY